MNDNSRCPNCGVPRPANSPEGLCPRCLMHQALAGSDADAGLSLTEPARPGVELTVSLEPASSSAWPRIAESIGGVPHVLLRDTEIETGPGPILKPSSPEMPEPPERPDKYQLFGEIARGGMGAVLRGRDVDLGRDLAVKVLLESHKEKPELVRRFVEEAQIGGQLQHPGVVPVYELGTLRRPAPVLHDEAGERPHAGRAAAGTRWARVFRPRPGRERRSPPALRRPAAFPLDLRVGRPDDGLCARARRDPSRPEAVEHHGGQLRRGTGDGLGPGEGLAPGRSGRRRAQRGPSRRCRSA